jgi:hypothetical protein
MSCNLIIRSDDAGSSISSNDAILKVINNGIVKNVSIMACGPFVEDFYQKVKGIEGITFGLHFCLNSEWDLVKWGPVSKLDLSSGLVDEKGWFISSPSDFLTTKPSVETIMKEALCQLELLQRTGFKISYLDSHMLSELYIPGLSEALSQFCIEHNLVDHKYYYNLFDFTQVLEGKAKPPEGQYFIISHPSLDTPEMRLTGNSSFKGEDIAKSRAQETVFWSDNNLKSIFSALNINSISYLEAIPYGYDTIQAIKGGSQNE